MTNVMRTLLFGLCIVISFQQTQAQARHTDASASLAAFLKSRFGPDGVASYRVGSVRLHAGSDEQVIVYLEGNGWCGTGGCTMLILEPQSSSFKIINKITIVNLPIRVLSSTTNGWHDISVFVEGGGIQPGYEARLAFNGKKYPSNPSAPPAVPLKKRMEGKTVVLRPSQENTR